MKTKTYEGLLSLHSWGEASDVLYLSSVHDPLADELSFLCGKKATVRYWLTHKQCSKDEASEAFTNTLLGLCDIRINSRYSEYTGYLWTDEDLNIGGHNLLEELKSSAGKWLILEVEYD